MLCRVTCLASVSCHVPHGLCTRMGGTCVTCVTCVGCAAMTWMGGVIGKCAAARVVTRVSSIAEKVAHRGNNAYSMLWHALREWCVVVDILKDIGWCLTLSCCGGPPLWENSDGVYSFVLVHTVTISLALGIRRHDGDIGFDDASVLAVVHYRGDTSHTQTTWPSYPIVLRRKPYDCHCCVSVGATLCWATLWRSGRERFVE